MDHQQTCVICKYESTVSGIWHSHNPFTCMGKVCNRVFKNLSNEIRDHFLRGIDDNYIDRGKYFSKIGNSEYIDLEVDLYHYRFSKRFYEDNGQKFINETFRGIEFWQEYSEWIAENCEVTRGTGRYQKSHEYSYAYVEVVYSEEIYPKISQVYIDDSIHELIILERAKSLTDDIKRICKRNNINTFFCNRSPAYKGLVISKTYI